MLVVDATYKVTFQINRPSKTLRGKMKEIKNGEGCALQRDGKVDVKPRFNVIDTRYTAVTPTQLSSNSRRRTGLKGTGLAERRSGAQCGWAL